MFGQLFIEARHYQVMAYVISTASTIGIRIRRAPARPEGATLEGRSADASLSHDPVKQSEKEHCYHDGRILHVS